MRKQNLFTRMMPMDIAVAAGLVVCLVAATEAVAQRGGFARQPLSPEKAEVVWKLQADGVSQGLGLEAEQSGKVLEAYVTARQSQQEAMRELRIGDGAGSGGGRGGRERFQAFRELSQKEVEKLGVALKAFLSKEQTTEAIGSLGAFDATWDRYVDVLAGLKLKSKALASGLKSVQAYIIDYTKARGEAMANQDFESIRSKRAELKAKLDTGLADVLSEEQLAKWNEQTARRWGGRRGGDNGQRGGDGEND